MICTTTSWISTEDSAHDLIWMMSHELKDCLGIYLVPNAVVSSSKLEGVLSLVTGSGTVTSSGAAGKISGGDTTFHPQ